jgi:putative transposase
MGPQQPHRKRCKRWDSPGHAHYLTFSCFMRQRFLRRQRPCLWLLESLDRVRAKRPFDLLGFVIMPEHVRLLLLPHEGVKISSILQSLKLPVTRRAIRYVQDHDPRLLQRMLDVQPNGRRAYRFWQRGGGYDRNMRTVREAHEKLNYIHLNPVRRGFVTRPEDWPWSSARDWATGIDEPLRIDRDSLPPLELTKPWEV